MVFQYKRVLVVGATSGIGNALANRFIQEGAFVIASGRRKENLEKLVHQHGREKVAAVPFDVTNLDGIPSFAHNITSTYPDLDCVFLNSGIQRGFNWTQPESIDMDLIGTEMLTNYTSFLALTKAFLPFLMAKKTETSLIYTTSGLALVPISRCSNYCASKAALHHWILCLRKQLRDTKIKVIELFPPAVQTELHDAKHQPDIEDGGSMGMPLDEFTEEAYSGLAAGEEQVAVGFAKNALNGFEVKRQEIFAKMP